MSNQNIIDAGFSLPVRAFSTTRAGGISQPPFDTLNLSAACGDEPDHVAQNRLLLRALLPSEPLWLRQVHGNAVIHLDDWQPEITADAAWTDRPGQVAVVLTADCLPILLAAEDTFCVAAIHAGWRGLAAGVIENTITAMTTVAKNLRAWIGPSIRQAAYEVGNEVVAAFADYPTAFVENANGRWQADLQSIAQRKLTEAGVNQVDDCGLCTHQRHERLYSHRRNARTGRQASLIWFK
ncbi:MAG: peptidoglycan editing factor PgeF [Pseudomonadota bacterium]